jgi:parallel beta-helix repeat protein
MMRKSASGIALISVLVGVLVMSFNIQKAKGQGEPAIVINPDGTVSPPEAPLERNGDMYTFMGDIGVEYPYAGISVERSNIVVDGGDATLNGWGHPLAEMSRFGLMLAGVSNVTIRNSRINGFSKCIIIESSSNVEIYSNTIEFCYYDVIDMLQSSGNQIYENRIMGAYSTMDSSGIRLSLSNNNVVYGNLIMSNSYGVYLDLSEDNKFYHNNFKENIIAPAYVKSYGYNDLWDDGYPSGGNYWSNYAGVDLFWGSYQNLAGSDGTGDTPYIIDGNNKDHYPLMSPYEYWSSPIQGDVNKDMKVDIQDLVQLATGYGSAPGDFNWNPNCDFSLDNIVSVSDLYQLGRNYGKTYP